MKYTKDQIVEMAALWLDDSVSTEEWDRRTEKFGGTGVERFDVVYSALEGIRTTIWTLQRS